MKRFLTVIIAAAILLSACGDDSGNDTRDSYTSEKIEGEWIVNRSTSALNIPVYSVDTFEPIVTKSSSVSDAMRLVYEPLFEQDENLRAVGVLADGYSVSADGLTVEVRLKSGVKWHDGTQFTASDVDYTVNAIRNGDSVYKGYLSDVVSSSKSGNKYVFRLSRPIPNFTSMLTFPIIKKGTTLEIDADYIPMGTGPYKYAGKSAAKKIKLAANDDWHGGDVGIKNVCLCELKDKQTAVAAFEANEVSCITGKTIDLNKYTPKGKITTVDYVSNKMVYLGVNFYKQILWGKSTRQALGYMINKEELAEKQAYERAVAVDVPVNPSAWYYDTGSKVYFCDNNMVHDLLIADGWSKADWGYTRSINDASVSLKLEILVNAESAEKVEIANAVARYLSENEVVAEVKAVPYAEYVNLINAKQFDLFIGEIVMPNNMDPTFLVGSGGNYFTYSNAYMDSIISDMAKSQTDDGVKSAYAEFGKLFNDEIPFIPLFFRKESIIFDDEVSGEIKPTFTDVYGGITRWYMEQK